jgi:hypothetical protein
MQPDIGTVLTLGAGLCLLALVGVVLFFGLQIFATFFSAIGSLFDVVTGFVSGGPGLWCGCAVLLAVLGACAVFTSFTVTALQACGTPQATNLCSLFGR